MHNQFPKEHIIYYALPNHVLISAFFLLLRWLAVMTKTAKNTLS